VRVDLVAWNYPRYQGAIANANLKKTKTKNGSFVLLFSPSGRNTLNDFGRFK